MDNLGKSIKEIFNARNKYIIPLYQRNYAWGKEQIEALIQDIYEAYEKDKNSNYYIGSLVVLRRHNGDYEVIDGQQRLTTCVIFVQAAIKVISAITNDEYKKELEKKLLEECKEVLETTSSKDRIEELADMLEIIISLAKLEDKKLNDVIKVANDKKIKRGGFEKKIFLESVFEE